MNAWVCDGCGAIKKDRPAGWFNVRTVVEEDVNTRSLFDLPRLYGGEQMFCSTDCIAATFVLHGVERGAER